MVSSTHRFDGSTSRLLALRSGGAGAELRDNFGGRLAGAVDLVAIERDGADAGVSSTSVTLADLGEVGELLGLRPRIRANRHLGAKAAAAQSHAIGALGMEVIRDELVVSLELVVGDI